MAVDIARTKRVGQAIVHEARVEKIPFLAGSIAYHAFVSLLPLFALLLYIASGLGNASLEAGLIRLGRAVFTEGTQDLLIQEMRDASRSTGLSVLGIGILLWGTLRIFRGLDTAFSDIYETEHNNSFVDQLSDGVLVLVTFSISVLFSLVVYRLLPTTGAFSFFQPVALVIGLTIALYPMYYVFPDADVSVVEVLPGTVLAAVGLTVFQAGFQLYVRSGEQNVIGGVLLLLTWLYVSGLVILLGVVVNAVLSNRSADVSIRPVLGGVPRIQDAEQWTQAELDTALSALSASVDTGSAISVSTDGETIELPPPQRFEFGTDEQLLGMGSDERTLTLRWHITSQEPDDKSAR